MKDLFPGYYNPTEDELAELWNDCVFVFDANVLLNLYSYSDSLREEFLALLTSLASSDRLWIPYQVAHEYQRNRLKRITAQTDAFAIAIQTLEQFDQDLKSYVEQYNKQFRAIDFGDLVEDVDKVLKSAKRKLQQQKRDHPKRFVNDPIRDKFDAILTNKVGKKFTDEELERIFQKGERRFQAKQPPSFEDAGKGGIRQYGDLVIWFEIIKFAKSNQRPIIFVTDDAKSDWWLTEHSTCKPHPELIQEIYNEANVKFYMYQSDNFLTEANFRLNLTIEEEELQEKVEEIRDIREAETTMEEVRKYQLQVGEPIYTSEQIARKIEEGFKSQYSVDEFTRVFGTEKTVETMLQLAKQGILPDQSSIWGTVMTFGLLLIEGLKNPSVRSFLKLPSLGKTYSEDADYNIQFPNSAEHITDESS